MFSLFFSQSQWCCDSYESPYGAGSISRFNLTCVWTYRKALKPNTSQVSLAVCKHSNFILLVWLQVTTLLLLQHFAHYVNIDDALCLDSAVNAAACSLGLLIGATCLKYINVYSSARPTITAGVPPPQAERLQVLIVPRPQEQPA